jgi:hypothetical protein
MTIIKVNHQPTGGKEWVAEITGRSQKYGLNREFLKVVARNWSSTGRTGSTAFELEENKLYEVNEPYKGRRFVTVREGQIQEVSPEEAMGLVEKMEKGEVA